MLEEMMDRYIHLRKQARDAFEIRYERQVNPDKDRWELCVRIPLKLSTQSGEVDHLRSEATLEFVHGARGGQHHSRSKVI